MNKKFIEAAVDAARIELIAQAEKNGDYFNPIRGKFDGDIDFTSLVKAVLRVVMEPIAVGKSSFPKCPMLEGMTEEQMIRAAEEYQKAIDEWVASG